MMKTQRKKSEKRGERSVCVCVQFDFSSPFPKTTKSPKNILNNNIQIKLIKENIKNKTKS